MTKTKKCTKCKQIKFVTEFYHNKSSKDGLCYQCKKCHNKTTIDWDKNNKEKRKEIKRRWREKNRDELKKYSKEHYESNKDYYRDWHLKKHYNISLQDYEKMVEIQNSCCAICKCTCKNLVIDHCHNTGLIRELLCNNCNTGIGLLKNDTEIFLNAIHYIKKYGDLLNGEKEEGRGQ